MNYVGVRFYGCATEKECAMHSKVVGKRLFSISVSTPREHITIHLNEEEVLNLADHLVRALDKDARIAKVMK